ncbi:MAG: hypothetical protein ACK5MQ_09900 [Pikeienuella sp.]
MISGGNQDRRAGQVAGTLELQNQLDQPVLAQFFKVVAIQLDHEARYRRRRKRERAVAKDSPKLQPMTTFPSPSIDIGKGRYLKLQG